MEEHIHILIVTVLLIILPAVAARRAPVPAMILFLFLAIVLPLYSGINTQTAIASGISLALLALSVRMAIRSRVFKLDGGAEIKLWRIIGRPFAALFIPINIYMGHRSLIYLLGILSLIFILTDLYRLFFKRNMPLFFKRTESRRFSSITSFLVAVFIVFLVFPSKVAYLCLVFVIFGDIAGKFIGLKYGRKKIVRNRTLEGSLGFLTGCLFAGYILLLLSGISFSWLMIGALCATLSELFSFSMDDNFTVGILTGACLLALQYFQVI